MHSTRLMPCATRAAHGVTEGKNGMICDLDLALLDGIAHLPQHRRLATVAAELWSDRAVVAVWLGGSLARGGGDAWSDVDLRVAVTPEAFAADTLPAGAGGLAADVVGTHILRFGERAVLFHMLLGDGQIYDLLVQTADHPPTREARVVLACRDAALGRLLAHGDDPVAHVAPADPLAIRQVIVDFWMNQPKLQRVLARGLPIMAWEGLFRMRQDLVRLWYVLATGDDPGTPARMTVHTFTPVARAIQQQHREQALALLGGALRDEPEIVAAAHALADEVARVGRALAERLAFEYPEVAESSGRRAWRAYADWRARSVE
jgi:predicted nucleotidyltransferase